MTITLGENLKRLRNNLNLTQEQLAESLNVSPQAISRWETAVSYPDIATLPVIAAFFNISVDTLLGVDPTNRKKQIEDILGVTKDFHRKGKISDAAKYLHKKLKEYPNSAEIMSELASSLYLTDAQKHSDEIIALCQKVYKLTDNLDFKFGCMQTEALTLAEIGENDKALEIVANFPIIYLTKNSMAAIVAPWKKRKEQQQWNLIDYADMLANQLRSVSYWVGTTEQNIEMLEKAIQIVTIIMGEDAKFYNERVCEYYLRISELYCELKDTENAFKSLMMSVKYADMYETRPEGGKYDVYWLSLIEDNSRADTSKNTELNEYEEILEALKKKEFDSIREDKRFNDIIITLKQCNQALRKN